MNAFGANARLIDAISGQSLGGRELAARILAMESELDAMPAGLLLLSAPWTIDTVCRYLAAFRRSRPQQGIARSPGSTRCGILGP